MPVHVSGYTFTTSSSSFKTGRKGKTDSKANLQVFNDNKKHNYVFHQRDNKLINKLQNEILSPGPMGVNMVASTNQIEDIITKTRRRRRQQKQRRRLSSTTNRKKRRKNNRK